MKRIENFVIIYLKYLSSHDQEKVVFKNNFKLVFCIFSHEVKMCKLKKVIRLQQSVQNYIFFKLKFFNYIFVTSESLFVNKDSFFFN